MAKRQTNARSKAPERQVQGDAAEHRLEDFAVELGSLLGNAQSKAKHYLDQRAALIQHLQGLRDTASSLLTELGNQAQGIMPRRRGRRPSSSKGFDVPQAPSMKERRKRAALSPEARERIAAAQRKRWAKIRKKAK